MTTIINNPAPAADAGVNNVFIGASVLIGIVLVFVFIGIPMIQRLGPNRISVPPLQVTVPDKVNVNIIQPK
jgi:hypothetical protein